MTDPSEDGSENEGAVSDSFTSQPDSADTDVEEIQTKPLRERIEGGEVETVFRNKDLVRPETIIDEDRIVGRDEELDVVIDNLRPVLHGKGIPDMILSGPSGTGKSLIIHTVAQEIQDIAQANGTRFGVFSINCDSPPTTNRVIDRIIGQAVEDIDAERGVPKTGIATDLRIKRMWEILKENYDGVIFILDEIDMLTGPYEEEEYNTLLYQLSRPRDVGGYEGPVSVTTITNYADFLGDLNSRASSSYNPDDIFFTDYNATQLRRILNHRRDAFKEDALEDGVIPLIAAVGSSTHGDARIAIDLFRWAGEVADDEGVDTVTEEHVRSAQDKYNVNKRLRHISGLSVQKKICLYAVAATDKFDPKGHDWTPTKPAHGVYQFICDQIDMDPYQKETFNDHVTDQSTSGLLTFEKKSRGFRKGVHFYINLAVGPDEVMDRVAKDDRFEEIKGRKEMIESVVVAQLEQF